MDRHDNALTAELTVVADGDPVPDRLRTDRLDLRRVHPDHVKRGRLHALFGDVPDPEAVFEHCGWSLHESPAATREYLENRVEDWENGDRYEYALESDDDGYVGTCCLDPTADGLEFGYWLRKQHWGRGFCGEGVDALVHLAFRRLAVPYVLVGCRAENDRSRGAIEKFVRRYGGAYVGSPPRLDSDTGEVISHHEWAITHEAFAGGASRLSTHVPGVTYDDLAF